MENKYTKNAKKFKALADPNRLIILDMLSSGEKCACKLLEELNINQSTLSHHMSVLCDAGIVDNYKEGKWTHYSISKSGCEKLIDIVNKIKD
ncbi:winged helix-turn-helix transcriptional regulator [Sedimentibacter sp. zth1]|uniref:ArsR/SmtB family transcription factor n=1 Tax=Sedimentibacter sp. zth1 TaxID=2816908 RepID=UPI001A913E09|nr:metalloregulator ArsR/SmtB family transcription factor [Sedimentibacter sp. zth1]QSX05761.1 winged helix-turn-helix transcriptional regulator [Sedimentibacter sp. zth1]